MVVDMTLEMQQGGLRIQAGGTVTTLPKGSPVTALYDIYQDQQKLYGCRVLASDFVVGGEIPPRCWKAFETRCADIKSAWDKRISAASAASGDGDVEDAEPVLPEPMDGSTEVFITEDKRAAWCVVFPPLGGGQPVLGPDVIHSLHTAGVTTGINAELATSLADDENAMLLVMVAKAVEPIDGKDGYLIDMIMERHSSSDRADDTGKIDYKNLDWIINAKEGQPLCEVVPPTQPINGMDVTGNEILAKEGRCAPPASGKNTKLSEDGRYIISAIDGQVSLSDGKYRVVEVLEIKGNVDFSTGNIKARGSVVIRGDVVNSFTVEAGRNVTVYGLVEGAKIVAGGDVVITDGMLGSNHGSITASGNIYCKFLENTVVHATGDIHIESSINSQIYSQGNIFVTDGKGVVIGGTLTAMGGIQVKMAGNRAFRSTSLIIGTTPCFMEEKRQVVRRYVQAMTELDANDEQQHTANEQLRLLQSAPTMTPALKQALEQLEEKLKSLSSARTVLKLRVENCETVLSKFNEREKAVLKGGIYMEKAFPGVQVSIGTEEMQLKSDESCCRYSLVNGELSQRYRQEGK